MGCGVLNGALTVEQELHAAKINATYSHDEDHVTPPGHEEGCFYCARDFDKPCEHVVFWAGNGAQIFLHADCAARLCMRLLGDVHSIEAITGQSLVMQKDRTCL